MTKKELMYNGPLRYKLAKCKDQNPETYKAEEFELEYARYSTDDRQLVKTINSEGVETYYFTVPIREMKGKKQ